MADATPTTRCGATEVLPVSVQPFPTPINTMFPQLLAALARHVAAERDLEHLDYWSGAALPLRVATETAFTEVATLLCALQRAPVETQDDAVLQDMALLIDRMIGSEEPGMFARLHGSLPHCVGERHRDGTSLARPRTQTMLMTAHRLIDNLARLELYGGRSRQEIEPEAGFATGPASF